MQAPTPTLHHPIPRLALLCFFGLLSGILTATWIGSVSTVLPVLCFLMAGCSLLFSWFRKSQTATRRLCTLALLLFALWRGADPILLHQADEGWIARNLVPLDRPVVFTGQVMKSGQTRNGRGWVDLGKMDVSVEGAMTQGQGRIRVYGADDTREIDELGVGDRVVLEAIRIRQVNRRAPNLFDPEAWRLREGFHAEATLLSVLTVERKATREWMRPFSSLASRIRSNLDQMPMEDPMKSILKAILTGDRSGLDSKTEAQLARAGVAHVMAVSGLHVGLVIAPFWWLFLKIRSHWCGILLWLGVGFILLLYAEVALLSPSVSRAALMSWMAGWIMILLRRIPSTQLLMMVGTILLFWNPVWIRHPGFQLSMVAVWSILTLHAPVDRQLRRIATNDRARRILSMVAMTAIIQVAVAPLLVWWFGEISIVAPLSNLLIVPIVPILTLSGWSWALLDGFKLDGNSVLVVAQWLIRWILYWTDRLSELPWATLSPGVMLWLVLVPMLIMSIKGYGWMLDTRHRTLFWYVLSISLFIGCLGQAAERKQLMVTVLDVGQGDAIHIQTPNGSNLLFDTGPEHMVNQVLIPYLNAAGVRRIDALLLTHPHADHVGGTDILTEEISVRKIYRTRWDSSDEWTRKFNRLNIPTQWVDGGGRIDLDRSIRLYLLESRVENSTVNNHSLVVKLIYDETSILFTGDAERKQEFGLVRTYGTWLGVDVLKAGHHGSRTSSNRLFLQFVNPEWTVISAGWMNRYDHPHREVIERVHRQGSDLLITAQSGTVRIVSNGSRIGPVH